MPRKKITSHPTLRPHTVPALLSGTQKKSVPKNPTGSNSTKPSSNSNSDELAVTLALHGARASSRSKMARSNVPLEVETQSSHSESNNDDHDQRYSPSPRPRPSKNPSHLKDFEPTKVYSKTLQSLGRPLSRVATAFIADIIGTPSNAGSKKRSFVKFTDEHKDFDVLDVNERAEDTNEDDDSQLNEDGLLGVTGAAALPKLIAKRGQWDNENELIKKISEHTEFYDTGSDTTSDSDAEPPPDPTAHVGLKIKQRLPTPYYQREEDVVARSKKASHSPGASTFVAKNQLIVQNLPLPTKIDDLKQIFPKATSIKLLLTRDQFEKYKRSATIEFSNATHAKSSYNKAKNARIGGSILEFAPHKTTLKDSNANHGAESDESEETIEDYLPQEQMDKDAMVREWIKIQSRYATKSKTFMKKYKL